jgi:hypothetical protein
LRGFEKKIARKENEMRNIGRGTEREEGIEGRGGGYYAERGRGIVVALALMQMR